ncbi:MAG: ABC transporter permease [bacterium]
MKSLHDIWKITKKDLLEFSRDRMRLVTFVIMPIFMMILTGFIFPSQSTLTGIEIGVVNNDDQMGQALIDTVANLEIVEGKKAFNVETYDSLEAIKEGIRKQEVSGGIVIPENFATAIAANEQTEVTIVEDQSNPQIMAITTQTLSQMVTGFSKGLEQQKVSSILTSTVSAGTPPDQNLVQAIVTPIKISLAGLFTGETNYFEFVAPGIMAMVVMTAVLTGLAGSVSREKEQGTLDGILISPIGRLSIILGKAAAQSIRGLIQGAIVLLLAVFLFGVTINGNLFLVLLILLLGVFSFVGLGVLVSASATEQETATQVLFMFQFPMLFLSGAFFPIQQMPEFMQKIAHVLPLTYAIEALRKVMILGGGISDISTEFIILIIFGVTTLIVSVPIFKKMVTR